MLFGESEVCVPEKVSCGAVYGFSEPDPLSGCEKSTVQLDGRSRERAVEIASRAKLKSILLEPKSRRAVLHCVALSLRPKVDPSCAARQRKMRLPILILATVAILLTYVNYVQLSPSTRCAPAAPN